MITDGNDTERHLYVFLDDEQQPWVDLLSTRDECLQLSDVDQLKISPFVPVNVGTVSPAAQWRHRATRDAWAIVAALAVLVYLMVSMLRRHELSVYLLTGSRRSEVAALHVAYQGAILTVSTVSALLWVLFLGRLG